LFQGEGETYSGEFGASRGVGGKASVPFDIAQGRLCGA
jgi:hypothetical protein